MLLLGSNWYLGDTNWYLTSSLYFADGQWQEAVVEVAGGRPLEVEDEHLV